MRRGATRHHPAVALRPLQVHTTMHQKKVSFDDLHHSGLGLGWRRDFLSGLQMLAVGNHPITSDFWNSVGLLVVWIALQFVAGTCLVDLPCREIFLILSGLEAFSSSKWLRLS